MEESEEDQQTETKVAVEDNSKKSQVSINDTKSQEFQTQEYATQGIFKETANYDTHQENEKNNGEKELDTSQQEHQDDEDRELQEAKEVKEIKEPQKEEEPLEISQHETSQNLVKDEKSQKTIDAMILDEEIKIVPKDEDLEHENNTIHLKSKDQEAQVLLKDQRILIDEDLSDNESKIIEEEPENKSSHL